MEYGQAAKVLGEYQKPGAEFPKEGLGAGSSRGCLAVKAIKKMACNSIELAVFDTAAATDGSCPLEHIADSSGIALSGWRRTSDDSGLLSVSSSDDSFQGAHTCPTGLAAAHS